MANVFFFFVPNFNSLHTWLFISHCDHSIFYYSYNNKCRSEIKLAGVANIVFIPLECPHELRYINDSFSQKQRRHIHPNAWTRRTTIYFLTWYLNDSQNPPPPPVGGGQLIRYWAIRRNWAYRKGWQWRHNSRNHSLRPQTVARWYNI